MAAIGAVAAVSSPSLSLSPRSFVASASHSPLYLSPISTTTNHSTLSPIPTHRPFPLLLLSLKKRHDRSSRLLTTNARTVSKEVSLGFTPPHFQLTEPLTGKTWTLRDFEGQPALLVMFICNHCPFVKLLKKEFVKLSNFYMKRGLAVVAISSNSVITHPQDGPEFMAEEAKAFGYPFPYLYDESQQVARDFGALCTPEFFLFKKDGRMPFQLAYHGQFDDSRPSNNVPVSGRDLSLAIDAVLSGQPVPSIQIPSVGCSIKWHPEG